MRCCFNGWVCGFEKFPIFSFFFFSSHLSNGCRSEGMLALWSALKSVVSNTPATKVLALGTGLYGYGIGDMAKQVGCQVQVIGNTSTNVVHSPPTFSLSL